ncbi:MAG: 1-acyl-sn-glycerol-3-phosphate acyltransferase [Bacteriovorax sp.]|nr:1-acyl-sn-glycerol-3-phosphate acyltransferase [Bacteriovorax sp.]
MSFFRVVFKSLIFIPAVMLYLAVAAIILAFHGFSFSKARPVLIMLISVTSKAGLILFGVEVRKNFDAQRMEKNYLIVSNHLSYLDIMIISSFFPTCFVTSNEMKETPLLGQLCLLGGCLFVERRKRSGITGEIAELGGALASGLNVVVFPEAKSNNGEQVLRFRRPLFQSAIISQKNVLPICLNYRTLDGEKISLRNRDSVFWYGDMPFLNHALNLFSHKKIVAELSVMKSLNTSEFADKNELADKSYEIVSNEFELITHVH